MEPKADGDCETAAEEMRSRHEAGDPRSSASNAVSWDGV